jgi:hypothetical protein
MIRRLASLPWLRPGTVRQLHRYYQDAMTSCRPSRRASLPSLGGTSACTRCFRSSADECTAEARSCSPGISSREYCRGNDRISQVPGESQLSVCTCSVDSGGIAASDHYDVATWPLMSERQRLPQLAFRSSIAWLSDWLSTLRRPGYPDTTQDSLPAVGQTLPDGLSTRRIPSKGFRVDIYISSSFAKLLGAIRHAGAYWGRSKSPPCSPAPPVSRRYRRKSGQTKLCSCSETPTRKAWPRSKLSTRSTG